MPDWLDAGAQYSWRWLVIALALIAALWLVARLRLIFIPIAAALLLSTFLVPPFDFLRRKGLPRLAATLIVFSVPSLLLAASGRIFGPDLIEQFDELAPALASGVDTVQNWVFQQVPGLQSESFGLGERIREELTNNASEITAGLIAGATLAIEAVAGILLTIVLAFFFVKDGDRLAKGVIEPLSPSLTRQARTVGPIIWSTLTSYVRGVAIVGAVDAVAIGAALVILDVPLVGPLVLLTFLGAFFPLVGAVLSGIVSVLVALVSGGVTDALIVAAVVIAVQQLESDLIAPYVFSRAVNLHPVAVLLSLTAGAVLGGVVGAVLAVPIAASVASSFRALTGGKDDSSGLAEERRQTAKVTGDDDQSRESG